ncbi:thermonuclease family protein [Peptoniphilus catoniae]|uniref:thermonuclease family protein n=1 Tax=Peptoniphilus catoniae TaxID=1660341 RepID=UPI0010FDC903|nr:thermonuclease family protein [Peptoniphilus catoniae]
MKKYYFPIILLIAFFVFNEFFLSTDSNTEIRTITKVVDGDTVYTNKGEKIRIIGINAPELGEKEAYGTESCEFAQKLLFNKKVYLEKDKEDEDRYGRKLRYIWIKEPKNPMKDAYDYNFSALSLKEGLSRTYTFEPNTKYVKIFKKVEKTARKSKVGMWSISEDGTTRGNELR